MDVGNPSNLERMRALYDDDVYALREDVVAMAHDDDATRDAMRDVYERTGYMLDPHTGVGYLAAAALAAEADEERSVILLGTAHPAKFREDVESTLGVDIELPEQLEALQGLQPESVALAPALADLMVELADDWG